MSRDPPRDNPSGTLFLHTVIAVTFAQSAFLEVVRDELGLAIPIIAVMDFGHTAPFFVLPYGVRAEIDCDARRFSIVESAVV